jgi:hypothetical protein
MFVPNLTVASAIICGLSSCTYAHPPWTPPPGYDAGSPPSPLESNQTQAYYPPNANCIEYSIPITITSSNPVFNFTQWDDDLGLQGFLAVATTRAGAGYPGVIGGYENVTSDYEIAASFCTPKKPAGGKEKNVILATHGIGPGREHWNSAFKPEEYNFVQHAVNSGYSVFFYDRLGTGLSSK